VRSKWRRGRCGRCGREPPRTFWAPLQSGNRAARFRTRGTGTDPYDQHHPHPEPEYAGAQPSAPSASSASMPESNSANGLAAAPLRTVADDADDSADGSGGGKASTVGARPILDFTPQTGRLGSSARISSRGRCGCGAAPWTPGPARRCVSPGPPRRCGPHLQGGKSAQWRRSCLPPYGRRKTLRGHYQGRRRGGAYRADTQAKDWFGYARSGPAFARVRRA
jgi:hypothetical protein